MNRASLHHFAGLNQSAEMDLILGIRGDTKNDTRTFNLTLSGFHTRKITQYPKRTGMNTQICLV